MILNKFLKLELLYSKKYISETFWRIYGLIFLDLEAWSLQTWLTIEVN